MVSSHGLSNTKAHRAWQRMKQICYNTKDRSFGKYGGSGITVCADWLTSFDAFFRDMGAPPNPKHKMALLEGAKEFNKDACYWKPPSDVFACGVNGYVAVADNKNKQTVLVVLDAEDLDKVSQLPWYFQYKRGEPRYVYTKIPTNRVISMHRLINDTPVGSQTDHINGDGLDNRKSNLQSCNSSENGLGAKRLTRNTSGFRGVFFHKPTKKWQAQINIKGHKYHLGLFNDKQNASKAYLDKSQETI